MVIVVTEGNGPKTSYSTPYTTFGRCRLIFSILTSGIWGAICYHPPMLRLALIALTGCTTPAVDRETAGFNAEKFSQDLEFCRGGTATAFALKTVGGTLYGSFKGAVVGLHLGVIAGDGIEGMIIGAAAGGVAGLGLGAKEYLDDQTNTVEHCPSSYKLEQSTA